MLRAIGLFAIVVAICGAPPPARADCEVTDTGIPDDVAFKLDPGGVRQALAKGGGGTPRLPCTLESKTKAVEC